MMDAPPPLTREQIALTLFAATAETVLEESHRLHSSRAKDYVQTAMENSFTFADMWIEVREKQNPSTP